MKKKAVFFYSFSDKNAGDFSLNISAVKILVKNSFFVTIVSRFNPDDEDFVRTKEYFLRCFGTSVQVVSSPFKLDRSAGLLTHAINNFHGLVTSIGLFKNKKIERLVKDSDLVVLCGGNILRCGNFVDFMRLLALDYPLALARNYQKDYVIFPQSTADINRLGKWLLRKMINGSKVTFIRENISFKKIVSICPEANVVETLDLAFFLLNVSKFKKPHKYKKIAFTIRADSLGGLSTLPFVDKELIENTVIKQVLRLKELGHEVFFVVQGTAEDAIFTREIANRLFGNNGIRINVLEERDTFKLIDIYSGFDVLIGMRLHSIILAAVAGTPSYGFFMEEWGVKNPGILKKMGLPNSFVKDGINTDEVLALLESKGEFQNGIKEIYKKERGKIDNALKSS